LGTAAVLAAIDLIYVPAGRISKMYLVDAAFEVGWILAWRRADMPVPKEGAKVASRVLTEPGRGRHTVERV
jgi:hypothetical protein